MISKSRHSHLSVVLLAVIMPGSHLVKSYEPRTRHTLLVENQDLEQYGTESKLPLLPALPPLEWAKTNVLSLDHGLL